MLNGGATWCTPHDDRVVIAHCPQLQGVGAAKSYACEMAQGDVLIGVGSRRRYVLASTAIEEVMVAHKNGAEFIYSDWAQVLPDLAMDHSVFTPSFGWEYRLEDVDGRQVLACHGMAPTPHNMSYVWFAPNHLRAFPRKRTRQSAGSTQS